MKKNEKRYIHALRFDKLSVFYDPIVHATTREITFKNALIDQTQIQAGYKILDVGCGTGTLLLQIKDKYPDSELYGIDGDPKVLAMAKTKSAEKGVAVKWDQGMSFDLPYEDHSFDRVVSSLFFHHLTTEDKKRTLAEMLRVLKPNGELHIADFGKAQNIVMRTCFYMIQLLDGFNTTTDNVKGLLPFYFMENGFKRVAETQKFMTMFGTISLYRAVKPDR